MENRNNTELEDKVIELERCIVMLTGLVERASDNGSRHEMPFYMKHPECDTPSTDKCSQGKDYQL